MDLMLNQMMESYFRKSYENDTFEKFIQHFATNIPLRELFFKTSYDLHTFYLAQMKRIKDLYMSSLTLSERNLQEIKIVKLGNLIGSGGCGEVYEASDNKGFRYALKHVQNDTWRLEGGLGRLANGSQVIAVEGYAEIQGTVYLVMQLMKQTIYSKLCKPDGYDDLPFMSYRISCAINHLHKRNVIHRDIKGDNIYIGQNDDIYIGDFSNSCIKHPFAKSLNVTAKVLHAPEILLGFPNYNEKIDCYSFGLWMLQSFTRGRVGKFRGNNTTEILKEIFSLVGVPHDWSRLTSMPMWNTLKNVIFKPPTLRSDLEQYGIGTSDGLVAVIEGLLQPNPDTRWDMDKTVAMLKCIAITPICNVGCNGGTCQSPGQRACPSGYTGTTTGCTTFECSKECKNGCRCTDPNKCSCTYGWTGVSTGCTARPGQIKRPARELRSRRHAYKILSSAKKRKVANVPNDSTTIDPATDLAIDSVVDPPVNPTIPITKKATAKPPPPLEKTPPVTLNFANGIETEEELDIKWITDNRDILALIVTE